MKIQRIEFLDTLRGFAALIVTFHHVFILYKEDFHLIFPKNALSFFQFISELNFVAVLFFFVLSGFSIGLSLAARENVNWGYYFKRRAQRILPIYWIALLCSGWVSVQVLEEPMIWTEFIGNLLFLQSPAVGTQWFAPFAGNGPLWSLSFEAWFYVLTPCFGFLLIGNRPRPFFLVMGALALSVLSIAVNSMVFVPILLFLSYYVVWLMGFLLVEVLRSNDVRTEREYFLTIAIAIGVLAALSLQVDSDTLNAIYLGCITAMVFAAVVFISLKRGFAWFITLPRGLRLTKRLGEGSYALYALHMPFLLSAKEMEWPFHSMILGLVCLMVGCYYIETALIAFFRKQ